MSALLEALPSVRTELTQLASDRLADICREYAARVRSRHPSARATAGRLRASAVTLLRLLEEEMDTITEAEAEVRLAAMVASLMDASRRARRLASALTGAADCPDPEAWDALCAAAHHQEQSAVELERAAGLLARHAEAS